MISATPKSLKIVLRTIGTINIVLAVIGLLFLVGDVHQFLTTNTSDQSIPYFQSAFVAMTTVNLAFLAVLLVTGVRFIQARLSLINLYSVVVLTLFFYDIAIAEFWRIGGEIGLSVAAATGIGNGGVEPFQFIFLVPYLYPLVSIILLQVFMRRYRSHYGMINA